MYNNTFNKHGRDGEMFDEEGQGQGLCEEDNVGAIKRLRIVGSYSSADESSIDGINAYREIASDADERLPLTARLPQIGEDGEPVEPVNYSKSNSVLRELALLREMRASRRREVAKQEQEELEERRRWEFEQQKLQSQSRPIEASIQGGSQLAICASRGEGVKRRLDMDAMNLCDRDEGEDTELEEEEGGEGMTMDISQSQEPDRHDRKRRG
jgi:hypothetical protein